MPDKNKYIVQYAYVTPKGKKKKDRYAYIYLRRSDGSKKRVANLGKNLSKTYIKEQFQKYKALNDLPHAGYSLSELTEEFLSYREQRLEKDEIKQSTFDGDKVMATYIKTFFKDAHDLSYTDVLAFKKYIYEKDLSNRYRNDILTFLKSVCVWGNKMNYISLTVPPIDRFKVEAKAIKRLTDDEIKTIFHAIETNDWVTGSATKGINLGEFMNSNRAYMAMLLKFWLNTGLRPREVYDLDWQDIDLPNSTIWIASDNVLKSGKHGGRAVPIAEPIKKLLQPFLKPSGAFLEVPKRSIEKIFLKIKHHTGIDLNPYTLRKTFGSIFAERGLSMIELSTIMGSDLKTIQKYYVKISSPSLKSALEKGGCI